MTDETSSRHIGQYDGVRGTVRLLGEALALVKEDARRAWDVLRGDVSETGYCCQMAGCSSDAIGEFPRPGRYKSDLNVCRKHWLTLNAMVKAVVMGYYALVIGLMAATMWAIMVMFA